MTFVVTIRREKEKKQLELIKITAPVLANMAKTGAKKQCCFIGYINYE